MRPCLRISPVLPAGCIAAGILLSGCGPTATGKTVTNVSVEPLPVCHAVAERRRLGASPPRLGIPVRSSDVDDFSGMTEQDCNARTIVYAAPGSVSNAIFVYLYFTDRPRSTLALDRGAGTRPRRAVPGLLGLTTSSHPGLFQTRYAAGPAIVTVTAGCFSAIHPLTPQPCHGTSPVELRARAFSAARRLVRPLSQRTG
jgi:hypothetical protein